jgi:hypothetical protein
MSVIEKPWGRIVTDDATGLQQVIIKNRRLYVADEDFSLSPDTLCGSWFHVLVEGEMIWKGVVVGEVQAGRYLCQIDVLESGAEQVQRVFSLDTLMGLGDEARRLIEGAVSGATAPVIGPSIEWRLFDSEDKANAAYVTWVSRSAHDPVD